MGLFGSIRKAAANPGRFIATTGKSALRTIGNAARAVKSFASKVNEATGGGAGVAWKASKFIPGIGTATSGIERGLNMADKSSALGLKAIDLGERASKIKGVGDALRVADKARDLYKGLRP